MDPSLHTTQLTITSITALLTLTIFILIQFFQHLTMNTHYSTFCTLFLLVVALCFTFTSATPISLLPTTHSYTPGSANDFLKSPEKKPEQETHTTTSPKTPSHTQPCEPQTEQWKAPNGPAPEPVHEPETQPAYQPDVHEPETQSAYQPDVPPTGNNYATGASTPGSESTSLTSPTSVGDPAPMSAPIETTTTTTTSTTDMSDEIPVTNPTPTPAAVPSGPGSNVQLADGTQVNSSGDNTVSVAANEDSGAAGSNSEDGSVLSVAGPGVALGLSGLLGLGQTGGEIDATPTM